MKRVAKRWVAPWRPRLMPDLLVIGAQKAGTSALFDMLVKHPAIVPPARKELGFFSDDTAYARGWSHYLQQLPLRPLRGRGWRTLDATPSYLAHPRAAERIRHHLPDVRLVAVLRDPVKRAYSDWNMFRQLQDHPVNAHLHDPRSFEEAMQQELTMPLERTHYLQRGCYAPQLERYIGLFPKDRLLLFTYPNFKKDPEGVVRAILEHMGLEMPRFDAPLREVRSNVRPYAEGIAPDMEERLRVFYAPHLAQLADLLGGMPDLDERSGH